MRGNHLVREARKRAGLTQTELAERVGTTQSAIARLERGHGHPTMQRISELVEACGLELQVRLVAADVDDWEMVESHLRLAPAERLAKLSGAVLLAQSLQAAGRAHRAETANG